MTPSRRAARAVLLLAPLTVAACGGDDIGAGTGAGSAATSAPGPSSPPSTGAPAGIAADLDGRTFIATGSAGRDLVPGAEVRVVFDGPHLGGSGGCNTFGGSGWSIDGDRLVVDGLGAMTEMACEQPRMEQDDWLLAFLGARPGIALAGDTLTLTGDGATLVLTDREVTNPDRALRGTIWELDGLISSGVVSSVPAGVRTPTLVLDGERVEVDSGCNTGAGPVTITADSMTFGQLATTLRLCPGPAGDVETHVLAVLARTATYALDADRLTLMNGELGLTYRGAP